MKMRYFNSVSSSAISTERAALPAALRLTMGLAMIFGLSACDFEVTNPGPVSDAALDEEGSHVAIVQGALRQLVRTHNLTTVYGSYFALTGRNSGGTSEGHAYGATARRHAGLMDPRFADNAWEGGHKARWLAEDGIRRMEEVLGAGTDASEPYLMAHFWAGFANKLLGENMCYSVIDGGSPGDHKIHFERAEGQFTRAMELAAAQGISDVGTAALALRAIVRAWQGKWPEAVSDAAGVAPNFEWEIPTSADESQLHNGFTRANDPYSRWSVDGTYFEDYFLQTDDPRTPWGTEDRERQAEDPTIDWLPENKYGPSNFEAPHRVGLGPEMQLLIAEGLLRGGDGPGALVIINQRRADVGVTLRTASSLDEAWTALKLERMIELWLEGRALWDHRRYREENTPGPLPALLDVTGRDLCWPISLAERETNPNVPVDHP